MRRAQRALRGEACNSLMQRNRPLYRRGYVYVHFEEKGR